MSNILPLFFYPDQLSFTTIDDSDDVILEEAIWTDKYGQKYAIYKSSDEEGTEYVITGGREFRTYETKAEFVRAFLDLQKQK